MTRIIKGQKLLKEVFLQSQPEEPSVTMGDVYDSIITDWEWSDDFLIPKTQHVYNFYVPCSKSTINDSLLWRFEQDIPYSQIIKLAKRFGKDVVKEYINKYKEDGSRIQTIKLTFKVSKNRIYGLYMDNVRKALNQVALSDDVGEVWTVEQRDDEAIVGIMQNGGNTVLEYIVKYYKNSDIVRGLAEALDIWGERLRNPKFVLQIALYMGVIKLLGHNLHEVEKDDVDNLMGEVQDWLEEEFKKNFKEHNVLVTGVEME